MDSVVIEARPAADERFDTARVTAAVDELAAKHAGREDLFRAAVAQLLKAEMMEARAVAARKTSSRPACFAASSSTAAVTRAVSKRSSASGRPSVTILSMA